MALGTRLESFLISWRKVSSSHVKKKQAQKYIPRLPHLMEKKRPQKIALEKRTTNENYFPPHLQSSLLQEKRQISKNVLSCKDHDFPEKMRVLYQKHKIFGKS